jgi:hypothetical protein
MEMQGTEFALFVHEIVELFGTPIVRWKTVGIGISQWLVLPICSTLFVGVFVLRCKLSNYCR